MAVSDSHGKRDRSRDLTGLRTATGALASDIRECTDKGSATMFQDCVEDLMDDEDIETERRRYVLSPETCTGAPAARFAEPGNGRYVLDDGFVLGEVPAVKTNILPAGTGVFVEFSFISLVTWPIAFA